MSRKNNDSKQIAEQLNRFYKGYNFYPPQTPDKLAEWSNATVENVPVHHYFVAVDGAGNLLADGGLTESNRLTTIKVISLPLSIQLLNKVVRLIPSDAVIRMSRVDKFWFVADQAQAASAILQTMRYEFRASATGLNVTFDPRSPLVTAFKSARFQAKSTLSLALRASVPITESRFVCLPG